MSNIRLWIGLLALVCFLAGVTTGLSIPRETRGVVQRTGQPFDEYRLAFERRFPLDPEREQLFAELLRNYTREIEDARNALLRRSQPELESTLAEIGSRYRGYIRDHVLPPDRRAEFDALADRWQSIQ